MNGFRITPQRVTGKPKSASKPKPVTKPRQRTANVIIDNGWFLLQIAERLSSKCRQVDYYIGRQMPAGFGVGYQLEKQDAGSELPLAVYDVNLFGMDGYHLCDCRGFGSHGHCKHVEALLALVEAGKLPGKPANVPDDERDFEQQLGYEDGLQDGSERWTVSSKPTDTPHERDLYAEEDAAADQQWDLNHGRRPNVRALMRPDDGPDAAA